MTINNEASTAINPQSEVEQSAILNLKSAILETVGGVQKSPNGRTRRRSSPMVHFGLTSQEFHELQIADCRLMVSVHRDQVVWRNAFLSFSFPPFDF